MTWYQQISQLQGAGEQGAVKQLTDINQYGEYTIETNEHSLDSLVFLEIKSENQQVTKKHWTLEDLHELESKLVLITRPKSNWKKDKDCFQKVNYF